MSRGKSKLVKVAGVRCPICSYKTPAIRRRLRGQRGKIVLSVWWAKQEVQVIHKTRETGAIMRCPLCYGTSRISTELDAAYRMLFVHVRIMWYENLARLRKMVSGKGLNV